MAQGSQAHCMTARKQKNEQKEIRAKLTLQRHSTPQQSTSFCQAPPLRLLPPPGSLEGIWACHWLDQSPCDLSREIPPQMHPEVYFTNLRGTSQSIELIIKLISCAAWCTFPKAMFLHHLLCDQETEHYWNHRQHWPPPLLHILPRGVHLDFRLTLLLNDVWERLLYICKDPTIASATQGQACFWPRTDGYIPRARVSCRACFG